MRLWPRPTPTEPLNTSYGNVRTRHDSDRPSKADTVLGANRRANVSKSRFENRQDSAQDLGAEQMTSRLPPGTNKSSGHSTATSKQALPPWSTSQQSNRPDSDLLPTHASYAGQPGNPSCKGSSTGVQTHQFYSEQKPSIESLSRDHYDPSTQPLYVSQQTSASAVRDLALRKGSPSIHDASKDPTKPTKPLKSAMKSPKTEGDTPKKPKKLDLASLFPHPKSSNTRLLSPNKISQSPSAVTDATEFFSQRPVYPNSHRPDGNGNGPTVTPGTASSLSLGPASATSARVKVFERDIYDEAKTHKHHPPKGIKNWFDGFDISSDEDEEDREAFELLVEPPKQSAKQPGKEDLSRFKPHGITSERQAPSNSNGAFRPAQENLRATAHVQEVMRRRMESRESGRSERSDAPTLTGSASSGAVPVGHVQPPESRLANSRLESESVLSLSSGSEDEGHQLSPVRDSRLLSPGGRPTSAKRPVIPPRKMHSYQSFPEQAMRRSKISEKTIESVPIRLTETTSTPALPTQTTISNHLQPGTLDSNSQHSISRPTTSVRSREELRSAGGETVSSAPTDASHVMAVTEEEMMLLELMRKKRAAMAKNSFAEGYQLALKQEEEYLAKRRISAHISAMKMLKQKQVEDKPRAPSRAESRTASMFSEEREQRKRYSMIRKNSVDKEFRLERFLTAEASRENATPPGTSVARMERFLMMKPSLLDAIQASRPASGTTIEADFMNEQEDEFEDGYTYTMTDDSAVDENGLPAAKPISPMQRLAEMVRASPAELLSPDEGDVGEPTRETHDRVRAFLASSSASDNGSARPFPTPPSRDPQKGRQAKRLDMLSPRISEEESMLPEVPARSPNRTPLNRPRNGSKSPHTPSQPPPPRTARSEQPLVDVSLPNKTARQQSPGEGGFFAPLEVPLGWSGSPSITTSRPSPLTPNFPNFPPPPSSDKSPVDIADNESFRDSPYTSNSELPTSTRTMHSTNARRISKRPLPKIDTVGRKQVGRVASVNSMNSITSAGEDVLAAWAGLGGGSDAYAARRRGR
ncbi:hypothetical protein LTR37_010743 [Vermiconidia calcicola]|uniref:Uncharacterized protein n=1 Tax=Vermiconidia calcicola TaxID=1690605 RepID=A0ACC3N4N8_9PEZI|nr:hypothetical protein LTR37_010743 [Vermiconidia calcicola]